MKLLVWSHFSGISPKLFPKTANVRYKQCGSRVSPQMTRFVERPSRHLVSCPTTRTKVVTASTIRPGYNPLSQLINCLSCLYTVRPVHNGITPTHSSKAGQTDYKPADQFINRRPVYKPVRLTISSQQIYIVDSVGELRTVQWI